MRAVLAALALLAGIGSAAAQYYPPSRLAFPRSQGEWYVFMDCSAGGITGSGIDDWLTSVTGTAATLAAAVPWAVDVEGVCGFNLGTTDTNAAVSARTGVAALYLGSGVLSYHAKIFLKIPSDGTDRQTIRLGFSDAGSGGGEPANGVFARQTDNVNGGEWQCVSRAAAVESSDDMDLVVADETAYKVDVNINADATSATCTVNGTVSDAITTNIPTAVVGVGATVTRTVGATDSQVPWLMDEQQALKIRSAPR